MSAEDVTDADDERFERFVVRVSTSLPNDYGFLHRHAAATWQQQPQNSDGIEENPSEQLQASKAEGVEAQAKQERRASHAESKDPEQPATDNPVDASSVPSAGKPFTIAASGQGDAEQEPPQAPASDSLPPSQRDSEAHMAATEARARALCALMSAPLASDAASIREEIVRHARCTLGCTAESFSAEQALRATALALRDRMLLQFNATEARQQAQPPRKQLAYLSLEFLVGSSLASNLGNMRLTDAFRAALDALGVKLSELCELERDAALGNGGLGRLAACFLDSLATLRYSARGYGLRYTFGLFEQRIENNEQVELPDAWLEHGGVWLVERPEVRYDVRFYGAVTYTQREGGGTTTRWEGGEVVTAVASDHLVPGDNAEQTVLALRLWGAQAEGGLDMELFQAGEHERALQERGKGQAITAVLYPDDASYAGKMLRLKQQYFLVAATLQDILARVRAQGVAMGALDEHVTIQLNDTHPALGIAELIRLLVDEEGMGMDAAWEVTRATFSYTNHTVLPEALELWPVSMLEELLPRHMDIIYQVNHRFLQEVRTKWPHDDSKQVAMSLIQEPSVNAGCGGGEKLVRMAHLAIVGSRHVNGVAELHSHILQTQVFSNFHQLWPRKFSNVTNGVTPRRWILQANPDLAALLTSLLGGEEWRWDLERLEGLRKAVEDPRAREQWRLVKRRNKQRLAELVLRECGIQIEPSTLFDVQVKRIHEYKRQLLNVLWLAHRYSELKRMRRDAPGLLSAVVPRTVIFSGKAARGYQAAKCVIKLILNVAEIINNDKDVNKLLKVVFIPNYNVRLAQYIIPGSDVSQHLSTCGMEASGTSNMKFAMNAALILGTLDGATAEILQQVGEKNMFVFGTRAEEADAIRQRQRHGFSQHVDSRFHNVLARIRAGDFGPPQEYEAALSRLETEKDDYLLGADFGAYLEAQARVDRSFRNEEEWTRMAMLNCAGVGKFSSDVTVAKYAEKIWGIEPLPPPSQCQPR